MLPYVAVLISVLLGGGNVFALDGAALYQSKTCFACHGMDAKSPIMPNYPKLAGQNAAYTFQQMKDIKSGARANGLSAAMQAVMQIVSEDEMKAIAEWLESLE
tara:strand:- start:151 stop:459 length:309 start_codon:yes stop_codon:yes gene_type:complete